MCLRKLACAGTSVAYACTGLFVLAYDCMCLHRRPNDLRNIAYVLPIYEILPSGANSFQVLVGRGSLVRAWTQRVVKDAKDGEEFDWWPKAPSEAKGSTEADLFLEIRKIKNDVL